MEIEIESSIEIWETRGRGNEAERVPWARGSDASEIDEVEERVRVCAGRARDAMISLFFPTARNATEVLAAPGKLPGRGSIKGEETVRMEGLGERGAAKGVARVGRSAAEDEEASADIYL